jgi:HlyD family secretion protein
MTKRWTALLAILVVAALALAAWWVRRPAATVPGVLEASGRIEGDQAAVGAKIAGKIVRVAVREGESIAADALIAELASEQVTAQLDQAEHGIHAAREQLAEAEARLAGAQRQAEAAAMAITLAAQESSARIGEAEAALGAAQAGLRQAEADLEKAAKDYARYRELFQRELIAAQQLDQAKAADAVARAAVDAARQQVARAEEMRELARASRVGVEVRQKEAQTAVEHVQEARAALESARARIQTLEAARNLARANVADSRVVAPFAGTVLKKLVEAGEVIAAGTPLVTLVDLSKLHAKVYVAENDLGTFKIGDGARVYADAFPQRYFDATVAEVAQQAEFTPRDVHMKDERVKQVFAVKLAIRNPEGLLKPGMPVDARIRWRPEAPWGDRSS